MSKRTAAADPLATAGNMRYIRMAISRSRSILGLEVWARVEVQCLLLRKSIDETLPAERPPTRSAHDRGTHGQNLPRRGRCSATPSTIRRIEQDQRQTGSIRPPCARAAGPLWRCRDAHLAPPLGNPRGSAARTCRTRLRKRNPGHRAEGLCRARPEPPCGRTASWPARLGGEAPAQSVARPGGPRAEGAPRGLGNVRRCDVPPVVRLPF